MMRLLFPAIVAAALALVGCGGGGSGGASGPPLTKAQYQSKLQQIAKDVSAKLGSATSSSKKPTLKDVERFQTAIRAFADQLGKVNPPAAIKGLHAQLVSAMRQLADEFPGIADKLQKAKGAAAGFAAFFGAKSIQALIKLQAGFKAKGYNLNLSGG